MLSDRQATLTTQRDVGAELRVREAASTFAPQRCVSDKSPRAATTSGGSLQKLKADTLSSTGGTATAQTGDGQQTLCMPGVQFLSNVCIPLVG